MNINLNTYTVVLIFCNEHINSSRGYDPDRGTAFYLTVKSNNVRNNQSQKGYMKTIAWGNTRTIMRDNITEYTYNDNRDDCAQL